MTSSYLQDAAKCKDLYEGRLYSKRKKKAHECKEDEYRYYVDFDVSQAKQFDFIERVKETDQSDESNQDQANALDVISMQRLIKYCMKLSDSEDKEEDHLRFRGIYGNGLYKFQPKEYEGKNWPGHEVIDTRFFGISPGATDIKDAVYCFYKRPVPTSELKESFPAFADQIMPDPDVSFNGDPSTDNDNIRIGMDFGSQFVMAVGSGLKDLFAGGGAKYKQTKLTEFYYKDPAKKVMKTPEEIVAWVDENPGFGSKENADKAKQDHIALLANGPVEDLKYPFGRVLLICNNLKLDDYANPYPWFPFVNTKCYRRPKEFWSKGIIHVIREPVQNSQLIMSGCAASVDYRLRPVYYTSGANATQIQDMKRVPTDPNTLVHLGNQIGAKIDTLPVPPLLPSDVKALSDYRINKAEKTAGLDSTLAGHNQTGTYSGVQYEKQLDQATQALVLRFKELNKGREALGEMYLWFCQNWVTDERRIALLSPGEQSIYMTLNQTKYENGTPSTINDVSKGRYKFYIEAGVNKPTSKAERASQMQAIGELLKPFDPVLATELQLKVFDMPGMAEIIQRATVSFQKYQQNQDFQAQVNQRLAQQKLEMEQDIKLRDVKVKETKAGADTLTAVGNVVAALAKSGIQVDPKLIMDAITVGQADTSMVTQGSVS
jgi:hypothetical protein